MNKKYDINKSRAEIKKIDYKIAKLFLNRMKNVHDIAIYKDENGLKIYDKKQEEFVINNGMKSLGNVKMQKYYMPVIKAIINASKKYQKSLM